MIYNNVLYVESPVVSFFTTIGKNITNLVWNIVTNTELFIWFQEVSISDEKKVKEGRKEMSRKDLLESYVDFYQQKT